MTPSLTVTEWFLGAYALAAFVAIIAGIIYVRRVDARERRLDEESQEQVREEARQ